MRIGIDGSRAFIKSRTGIEEYSYRVIENLRNFLIDDEVVLYIRSEQTVDFKLPDNWRVKKLWAPRLWTQLRLSMEMIFNRPDILFIPAHTVPLIHPKNTIVVIHGLEYEFFPKAHSLWFRVYMPIVIKNSCKWAKKIICVSENTKKDLSELYKVPNSKMQVIHEGYSGSEEAFSKSSYSLIKNQKVKDIFRNNVSFVFFVGRLEKRKNIEMMVRSFEELKKKYGVSHKLVLAGRPGYGYRDIHRAIHESDFKDDIIELGYISEEEKWILLKKAEVFLFATLYEGFGIPILEAQSSMTPVIASNTSSIPEVVESSAILVNPDDHLCTSENMYVVISNKKAREDLIRRGLENVKRFSWISCAKEIANIMKYPD